jgi:hypothetical protein
MLNPNHTPSHFVTPAKAGVQPQLCKFELRGLDSRFRGNDESG